MGRRLRIGTAGIPISAKNLTTIYAIKEIKSMELDAMELEFVRSVNISEDKAPQVKKEAEKHDIMLTCHAPYFINLNAKENEKKIASAKRIYNSAKITYLCGGISVAFHPGFYLGEPADKVFKIIKAEIKKIAEQLKEERIEINLAPETTGKPSQFGSFIELLKISSELDGVFPCLDYAHLHARDNGALKTYEDCRNILIQYEKFLGKEAIKNMHIQFAGVEYTEKGERRHLEISKSDLNFENIVKSWKEFDIGGVAISESPLIEKDALKVKKMFNS